MFRKLLAAGAAVVALSAAVPASAATIIATWTGTVVDGTDTAGRFGSVGANLAGAAFSAVFTYDTDLGSMTPQDGGTFFGGGPGLGGGTSPGSLMLTINGQGFAINGSSKSYLSTATDQGGVTLQTLAEELANGSNGGYVVLGGVASSLLPISFLSSFGPADPCTGQGCDGVFSLQGGTFGHLAPSTFSIDYGVSAVPEPATWAFMIVGFGLVGTAARRRASSFRPA